MLLGANGEARGSGSRAEAVDGGRLGYANEIEELGREKGSSACLKLNVLRSNVGLLDAAARTDKR